MDNLKKKRGFVKDAFHAYLLEGAIYEGDDEFPIIKTSSKLPNKVISLEESRTTKDFNSFVALCGSYDEMMELWKYSKPKLKRLSKFDGVISPDYYFDDTFPLVWQKWHVFMGRAISNYLTQNGVNVIPTVRLSDEKSLDFAYLGVEKGKTIAIPSFEIFKDEVAKGNYKKLLAHTVKDLVPTTIIILGNENSDLFTSYEEEGIKLITFSFENTDFNYEGFKTKVNLLLGGADYDREIMPFINGSDEIPNRLVPFSKAMTSSDYDQWVSFYEYDEAINRFWENPSFCLEILKIYNGVISTDYSLYRNMPQMMQIWNTFRSRALAYYLEQNGVKVIINIRTSDERSFEYVYLGLPKGKTISIGTLGSIQDKENRYYLELSLLKTQEELSPNTIVVYGSTNDEVFEYLENRGIKIISFSPQTLITHQKEGDK